MIHMTCALPFACLAKSQLCGILHRNKTMKEAAIGNSISLQKLLKEMVKCTKAIIPKSELQTISDFFCGFSFHYLDPKIS